MRRSVCVCVCDIHALQVTVWCRLNAAAEGWAGSEIVETIPAGSPDTIRQFVHEIAHATTGEAAGALLISRSRE